MNPITLQDLMTLEGYDKARSSFRQAVMARKKNRLASIGPDVVLSFEDRTTILYQVQEMLRVERIFKRAGIKAELDAAYEAYAQLIADVRDRMEAKDYIAAMQVMKEARMKITEIRELVGGW